MPPRIAGRDEVRRLLGFEACIPLMREAMIAVSEGRVDQPARQILPLPGDAGLFGVMPGVSADGIFGAKLISVSHAPGGAPSHQGLLVLFDPKTRAPACVLDAGEITRIRTAAATAAATDALARPDAGRLLVLGTGEQAEAHVQAIALVRPLRSIQLWGRNPDRARSLGMHLKQQGVAVESVEDLKAAAQQADIICATTAAAAPILAGAWIAPGAHVNLVGSSRAGPAEADDDLVARSRFVADVRANVLLQGAEFLRAKASGRVNDDHIIGEIGDVFSGRLAGRQSNEDITVYKSLGVFAQDLWAGWRVFELLEAEGA